MTMQWGTAGDFPATYERLNVPAFFRTYAEDLIARVGLHDGESLLDIATGTGIVPRVARAAAPGLARVVGFDMNAGMLAVAREAAAGSDVEWIEGDATQLPFEAGSFDVVTCQQGLQFFPERERALAEMRQVVSGGGRIGVACWGPLERQLIPATLAQAGGEALPQIAAVAGAPFALGPDELTTLVESAGFIDIETVDVQLDSRYPSATAALDGFAKGTPLALALPTLDPDLVARWYADALAALRELETGGDFVTPMATTVVLATAP